jgi:DNA-3-methyladenine glycosylase II
MFVHEIPAIAAGLDHLTATVPAFAKVERGGFGWRRRRSGFGGLIRMILGQQVSTSAAEAMWTKLVAAIGDVEPGGFLALDDTALAACGFSRQKMRYGRVLAETLIADPGFLARLEGAGDEAVIQALVALPGIGRWSAEIYLMFCLGRPDVWPAGDLGIVLGTQYLLDLAERPKPDAVIALAEDWRPYRSAASLLVWDHYASVAAQRRREQRQAARVSQQ